MQAATTTSWNLRRTRRGGYRSRVYFAIQTPTAMPMAVKVTLAIPAHPAIPTGG
jgi:hypothetical protein